MNKELLVKVLILLKEEPDLREMTIGDIEKRFYDFENYIIQLVEEILQDKETEHGTLTTWWLYDNVPKIFYEGPEGTNVEKAENFVEYMIKNAKPVG